MKNRSYNWPTAIIQASQISEMQTFVSLGLLCILWNRLAPCLYSPSFLDSVSNKWCVTETHHGLLPVHASPPLDAVTLFITRLKTWKMYECESDHQRAFHSTVALSKYYWYLTQSICSCIQLLDCISWVNTCCNYCEMEHLACFNQETGGKNKQMVVREMGSWTGVKRPWGVQGLKTMWISQLIWNVWGLYTRETNFLYNTFIFSGSDRDESSVSPPSWLQLERLTRDQVRSKQLVQIPVQWVTYLQETTTKRCRKLLLPAAIRLCSSSTPRVNITTTLNYSPAQISILL